MRAPERTEGPTPNRGAYSIAYFHDDGAMEIVEFDAQDREIHRTYMEAPKPSPAPLRPAAGLVIHRPWARPRY
jgi:hypothetical protein